MRSSPGQTNNPQTQIGSSVLLSRLLVTVPPIYPSMLTHIVGFPQLQPTVVALCGVDFNTVNRCRVVGRAAPTTPALIRTAPGDMAAMLTTTQIPTLHDGSIL